MPEIESRIDLEKMQAAGIVTFEVDLRDAPDAQCAQSAAPQGSHVGYVDDLDRRAVAVARRKRPDLAPGELAGGVAARVDVRVVALDDALGSRHELLDQELGTDAHEPRPDRAPLVLSTHVHRLPEGTRRR